MKSTVYVSVVVGAVSETVNDAGVAPELPSNTVDPGLVEMETVAPIAGDACPTVTMARDANTRSISRRVRRGMPVAFRHAVADKGVRKPQFIDSPPGWITHDCPGVFDGR